MTDEALSREAIRIYRRYQTEVVEALNLCPWAERSRIEGHVREWVLTGAEPDITSSLAAIGELDRDPQVDVGLLLYPRVAWGRRAFDAFVARLVRADAAMHSERRASFALAAFHPEAAADLTDPERLIPFVRRTPDPTVQLIRIDSLESVREGFFEGTQFVDVHLIAAKGLTRADTLPLRERIARANRRTVERLGVDALERRFAEIQADRAAAYAAARVTVEPPCRSS